MMEHVNLFPILDALVFAVTVAATIWMTTIIWFVQIVHYPLFEDVGEDAFAEYHRKHEWWTSFIVGPPMFMEATGSFYLYLSPPFLEQSVLWLVGFVLVLVPLASTAFIQVPQHGKLRDGYDPETIHRLVRWNWIRTVAWSLRGILCLYFLVYLMTTV